MKLFFILGNQLFPIQHLNSFKNNHIIFMAEDYELCTYEKHHKLKILLFLSAMRSHSDKLIKNKFKVEYTKIESSDFKKDYLEKAKKLLSQKKLKKLQVLKLKISFLKKKYKILLKKMT